MTWILASQLNFEQEEEIDYTIKQREIKIAITLKTAAQGEGAKRENLKDFKVRHTLKLILPAVDRINFRPAIFYTCCLSSMSGPAHSSSSSSYGPSLSSRLIGPESVCAYKCGGVRVHNEERNTGTR